jgi:aryl-phospho-beta-D-glucosidase BglC (GH1 family)
MVPAITAALLAASAISGPAQAQTSPARTNPQTPETLLSPGYLHRTGSQIIDSHGRQVRIDAVALHGNNDIDETAIVNEDSPLDGLDANMQAIVGAGFNTVTLAWNDASLHDANAPAYLAGLDAVVDAARTYGLKVILNHHNDEGQEGDGNCLAQQGNGLWYDSGPGTDDTDGCGTAGTVTQASFQADWVELARHYRNDSTVIGFDLDNEPLAYTGESTWGDGGVNDIHAMYTNVGNAVEAADPGVLVICEGPQNYGGSFDGGAGLTTPEGDLTAVATDPVVLAAGNGGNSRVIYSVHEYPDEVSGVTADSGAAAIARYNKDWGYLEAQNIAPVWIGEAGSTMSTSDDTAWAQTLAEYVDGEDGAEGGPTFTGAEQGVSTTWYTWDDEGLGALNTDGTVNQARYGAYDQWRTTLEQDAKQSPLIGSGYLSVRGSQIIGPDGKPVRLATVALHGNNDIDENEFVNETYPLDGIDANMAAIRKAGFNTVTLAFNDASLHDANAPAYLAGLDAVVDTAAEYGLKVILNHHNDEGLEGDGNCLAQPGNGLWFDSGPGTNDTDGCGDPGTVTQASFQADWVELAQRYKGDSTVIGFDLVNEPLAYTGESTWGDNGVNDIHAMYTNVGNAVEAADPGVLVICEGPQNYGGSFAYGSAVKAPEGDLTDVAKDPVVLTPANGGKKQVVYSVHEYAQDLAGITPDSGIGAIDRYNSVWGYLVAKNIAPVWIGEAGATATTTDDTAWADTLTAYVNGLDGAVGGPTFHGDQQAIGMTYYTWDDEGLGTLNADGTLNMGRYAIYSQWLTTP